MIAIALRRLSTVVLSVDELQRREQITLTLTLVPTYLQPTSNQISITNPRNKITHFTRDLIESPNISKCTSNNSSLCNCEICCEYFNLLASKLMLLLSDNVNCHILNRK